MTPDDLNKLHKRHPLDDDEQALQCAEALISTAMTLARQSKAHAFTLLLAAVGHFAGTADDVESEIAYLDTAIACLTDDRELAALARVPAHDPTGSPALATWICPAASNECAIRRQCTNKCGRNDTEAATRDAMRATYESTRAADPDPRDEDDQPGGDA